MTRILVIDNYDSFVFTLVGYIQQLGAETTVIRNDEYELADAIKRLGRDVVEQKYGNLFPMYEKIVDENPYETPMMIYPAIHYTMGGIWVDYELMTTIKEAVMFFLWNWLPCKRLSDLLALSRSRLELSSGLCQCYV